MSWFSSFMHPQRGYEAGQDELNKYYQQSQGYQMPFLQALSDPQALQDKWASGYKESEAAKNAEGMAQQHGLDAASGMGLMGSNTALQATQAGTTQIGLDDRQNYLNDLMQKYMAGAGMANNMGQNAMNMGQNSSQMAFGKQNAGGNMFGNLLGAGIGLGAGYLNSPNRWNTSGGR
jgi:hypothetical protein